MGVDLWRGLVTSDGNFLFVLVDDSESWRTVDKENNFLLHVRIVRMPNLLLGSRIQKSMDELAYCRDVR